MPGNAPIEKAKNFLATPSNQRKKKAKSSGIFSSLKDSQAKARQFLRNKLATPADSLTAKQRADRKRRIKGEFIK